MDTIIQANKRRIAIHNIIGALKGGRHLSLFNSTEFGVSEMHTCFCVIRRKIADGKIVGYTMKDTWRTTNDGIRYKEYWFENDNDD